MAALSRCNSAKLSRKNLRRAAGVGIFRREDDDRIDGDAELHKFAFAAMQKRRSETTVAAAAPAPIGTIWLTGGM